MAAGFDPDRFGRLTPRQYQLQMQGAAKARGLRVAETARAVWAALNSDADGINGFCAAVTGEAPPALPPEAMDGMLRAASARMNTISRADALKRMH